MGAVGTPKCKANIYKNIRNLGDYAYKCQCVPTTSTGTASGHAIQVGGPAHLGLESELSINKENMSAPLIEREKECLMKELT